MINVSNAFRQSLFEDQRNWLEYVNITLADGAKLNLTNADLWQGGMSIEDSVSSGDSFDVGAAIINQCTVVIENLDDRFSEYDFLNAEVIPYVGLKLPDGSIERVRKGTFIVDEPKYNGSIITLSCLDYMAKFDRPYSETGLLYPSTINQIVRNACSCCDVTLQTYNIPHGEFVVREKPSEESTTFREVIAWAAQIAGCFARCDTLGRLELKWYDQKLLEKTGLDGGVFDPGTPKYQSGDSADGGSFKPWNTVVSYDGGTFKEMEQVHHIFSHYSSPVMSTDDVVITGVKVLEKTKDEENNDAIATYSTGGEGYWIVIENNDLIQGGNGLQICTWLGQQLIGLRFRKASLNHASDPTIEAGDVGFFTDRKSRSYPIIVSYTRFTTGGSQTTESRAQNPARNSAARFSAQTKNYVDFRKDIQQEKTDRQKALDELGKRIDNSSGLFTTEEEQSDGSRIFYMHNKPSLDESDIVWKMTAEAWGVSTDGGKSWNAGMTVDGNTIVRILSAVGINAEWITAGQFVVMDEKGNITFLADKDTGEVQIVAKSFSLTSGDTIDSIAEDKAGEAANNALASANEYADSAAKSAVDAQTQEDIFNKLTDNKRLKGIWMDEGQLWINMDYLKTGVIEIGGSQNAKGHVKVYDNAGGLFFLINNLGAEIQCPDRKYAGNTVGVFGYAPMYYSKSEGYLNAYTHSGGGITLRSDDGISFAKMGAFRSGTSAVTASAGTTLSLSNGSGTPFFFASGNVNGISADIFYVGDIKLTAQGDIPVTNTSFRVYNIPSYFTGNVIFNGVVVSTPQNASAAISNVYTRFPTSSIATFSDIGSGVIGEDGLCYIDIDPFSAEAANTECAYYVFLQKEGEGDLWVDSKEPAFFVVKGTPGLKFSWELKAREIGHEDERIGTFELLETETKDDTNYGSAGTSIMSVECGKLEENERKMEEEIFKYYEEMEAGIL